MIVARHGQARSACMCLAADHTARRRQDSLAQGLPWVSHQNVLCPEGARGIEMCGRSDLEPIPAVPNGPFRAYCGGGNSPRVNPGLSFLAPSGRGPSGQRTGAKHVQVPGVMRKIALVPAGRLTGSRLRLDADIPFNRHTWRQ
jgi:hypothetical protein